MKVIRLTQPTVEPVSVEEAKAHIRQTEDDDDLLVASYVSAARERVENYCNRPFTSATFAILYDGSVPASGVLTLPLPAITAISSVSYRDSDDETQTWPSEAYTYDATRQELRPADNWPSGTALRVDVVAGDNSSPRSIPGPIRAAILLYTADLYDLRQAHVVGASIAPNPAAEMLMDPYRVRIGI